MKQCSQIYVPRCRNIPLDEVIYHCMLEKGHRGPCQFTNGVGVTRRG